MKKTNVKFCPYCGEELKTADYPICPNCKNKLVKNYQDEMAEDFYEPPKFYMALIPMLTFLAISLNVVLMFVLPFLKIDENIFGTNILLLKVADILSALFTGGFKIEILSSAGAFRYFGVIYIIAFIVFLFHLIFVFKRIGAYRRWDTVFHFIMTTIEMLISVVYIVVYNFFVKEYGEAVGVLEELTTVSTGVYTLLIINAVFTLLSFIVLLTYSERNAIGLENKFTTPFIFFPSICGILLFIVAVAFFFWKIPTVTELPLEYELQGVTQKDWAIINSIPRTTSELFLNKEHQAILLLGLALWVGSLLYILIISIANLGVNEEDLHNWLFHPTLIMQILLPAMDMGLFYAFSFDKTQLSGNEVTLQLFKERRIEVIISWAVYGVILLVFTSIFLYNKSGVGKDCPYSVFDKINPSWTVIDDIKYIPTVKKQPIKPITDEELKLLELPENYSRKDIEKLNNSKKVIYDDNERYKSNYENDIK